MTCGAPSTFMHAILNKETGLREPGQLLSQALLVEVPEMDRFIIVTDVAVNIAPDIDQKVSIIRRPARARQRHLARGGAAQGGRGPRRGRRRHPRGARLVEREHLLQGARVLRAPQHGRRALRALPPRDHDEPLRDPGEQILFDPGLRAAGPAHAGAGELGAMTQTPLRERAAAVGACPLSHATAPL